MKDNEYGLTFREKQILNSLLTGQTYKEISAKYGILAKTVSAWKYKIYGKIGVKTDSEMVEFARQHKWMKHLPPPDVPVEYDTIEAAAGPQARFLVGTKGKGYIRCERRATTRRHKNHVPYYSRNLLDMEHLTGYKGVSYKRLSEYRRVFTTRYLCDIEREACGNKEIETVPYRDGFCMVMRPGTHHAATLRLSMAFVRECIPYHVINECFFYVCEVGYGSDHHRTRHSTSDHDRLDHGVESLR